MCEIHTELLVHGAESGCGKNLNGIDMLSDLNRHVKFLQLGPYHLILRKKGYCTYVNKKANRNS